MSSVDRRTILARIDMIGALPVGTTAYGRMTILSLWLCLSVSMLIHYDGHSRKAYPTPRTVCKSRGSPSASSLRRRLLIVTSSTFDSPGKSSPQIRSMISSRVITWFGCRRKRRRRLNSRAVSSIWRSPRYANLVDVSRRRSEYVKLSADGDSVASRLSLRLRSARSRMWAIPGHAKPHG
jgi:hypothetical protein